MTTLHHILRVTSQDPDVVMTTSDEAKRDRWLARARRFAEDGVGYEPSDSLLGDEGQIADLEDTAHREATEAA